MNPTNQEGYLQAFSILIMECVIVLVCWSLLCDDFFHSWTCVTKNRLFIGKDNPPWHQMKIVLNSFKEYYGNFDEWSCLHHRSISYLQNLYRDQLKHRILHVHITRNFRHWEKKISSKLESNFAITSLFFIQILFFIKCNNEKFGILVKLLRKIAIYLCQKFQWRQLRKKNSIF